MGRLGRRRRRGCGEGAADLGGDDWGGEEAGWGQDLSEGGGEAGEAASGLFGQIWDAISPD